ncbi:MAG: ParB/RepB/Spo0J family partition protein [Defluviitaleaceae bacterium]|nr:ParB/RepB/Spo0J family partition protein [Defluviitaleaceae bacterium]
MAAERRALGKGLGALIAAEENLVDLASREREGKNPDDFGILEVDINKVEPNKDQPRKRFDEEGLEELANSIKQFGIIQPLIVTEIENNPEFYKIVAGERRWRAARLAQQKTVPVIIKKLGEMETLQIALIENIQRQDLNPIEEALCYQKLCDVFFFRQEDIAVKVGKSRASISGVMSLLKLDPRIQNLIAEGRLTASHGRKLLEIHDGNTQFEIGEKIIEEQLNISQVSTHLESINKKEDLPKKSEKIQIDDEFDSLYKAIEKELMGVLGTKVSIKERKDKGKIEIEYFSKEDLDRLIGMFKNMN